MAVAKSLTGVINPGTGRAGMTLHDELATEVVRIVG